MDESCIVLGRIHFYHVRPVHQLQPTTALVEREDIGGQSRAGIVILVVAESIKILQKECPHTLQVAAVECYMIDTHMIMSISSWCYHDVSFCCKNKNSLWKKKQLERKNIALRVQDKRFFLIFADEDHANLFRRVMKTT